MRYGGWVSGPERRGADAEEVQVAEFMVALRKMQLRADVLRRLGVPLNWNRRIPQPYAKQIVEYLNKYRDTFDELAKR